jgi:acetolactate synthase-1/2/3 large subunit
MQRYGTALGVVRALRHEGVDTVFFVTGGDQPFWIALKEMGMRLVLARSEAAAVAMADGYSRASGRPSVVYGQWGPGAANVAAALADAYWSRSPVVALTSSVPAATEQRFEYQELDQVALFPAVTKWNRRVPAPDRCAELAGAAVRAAVSGCPGPVHLDIPKDWLASDGDGDAAGLLVDSPPATRPAPTAAAVEQVVRLLGEAERPLIIAGGGVLHAGASELLTRTAERWGVPVATSMGGKGAIAETHPCAVGVTGRYSRKVANEVAGEADLVLAIGTDLGGMVTNGYRLPSPAATVVQVDIETDRLAVTRRDVIPVVADAGEFLARLAAAEPPTRGGGWLETVQARTAGWKREFERIAAEPEADHVRQETAISVLREHAHPEDVLVADTGFIGAWGGALWEVARGGRYFLRAAGTLGWAFAAAAGAQLALPERRAICLIGDGGIGYNLGDLETVRRLEIPVVTVVLNNNSLAYEYLVQKHLYDTEVPEVNDFADIDYGAVARAIGIKGHCVRTPDELSAALADSLATRVPALIDVRVSRERAAPTTSFEARLERSL